MAVFWICTVNRVDNTGMLSSLLSCTEIFCSLYHPTSKETGTTEEFGKEHSQDNWPKITRGLFHIIWNRAGEQEGRGRD